MTPPMRGQVFRVDLGHGAKPWVIVSNIQRDRNLQTAIAARITTTRKNAELPTIVELSNDDPLVGFVLCDDLVPLYRDELNRVAGALSVNTMMRVSNALRIALP
jgi:mRNA interferase MazF